MDEISEQSNPERWAALMRQWQNEHQPGWVATKTVTYMVIQKTDGAIVFKPNNAQTLYETTSF